jgi:hypothetical protein
MRCFRRLSNYQAVTIQAVSQALGSSFTEVEIFEAAVELEEGYPGGVSTKHNLPGYCMTGSLLDWGTIILADSREAPRSIRY